MNKKSIKEHLDGAAADRRVPEVKETAISPAVCLFMCSDGKKT